jgi:hypothetical protein
VIGSSFSFGLPVLAGVPVADLCVSKFTHDLYQNTLSIIWKLLISFWQKLERFWQFPQKIIKVSWKNLATQQVFLANPLNFLAKDVINSMVKQIFLVFLKVLTGL